MLMVWWNYNLVFLLPRHINKMPRPSVRCRCLIAPTSLFFLPESTLHPWNVCIIKNPICQLSPVPYVGIFCSLIVHGWFGLLDLIQIIVRPSGHAVALNQRSVAQSFLWTHKERVGSVSKYGRHLMKGKWNKPAAPSHLHSRRRGFFSRWETDAAQYAELWRNSTDSFANEKSKPLPSSLVVKTLLATQT